MSIQKVTVSRRDDVHELSPDLVRLPSGKLICIYRESDGHTVHEFSNIALRSSLDGGHVWSKRQSLIEARPNDAITSGFAPNKARKPDVPLWERQPDGSYRLRPYNRDDGSDVPFGESLRVSRVQASH